MDEPTGEFLNAIENGLIFLAQERREITVRFLIGSSPPKLNLHTFRMLSNIGKLLRGRGGKLTIYLGQYRYRNASWGHAKIIAVDGARMMTGGHNLWAAPYLEKDPVFDLSMRIDGPIAMGGHQFADSLWDFVRTHNSHNGISTTYSNSLPPNLEVGKDAPPERPQWRSQPAGSLPALWVTNPGWGVFTHQGTDHLVGSGMIALLRALNDARHCRISQQDLGARYKHANDFEEHVINGYPYRLISCSNFFFILPLIDSLAKLLAKSDSTVLELVMSPPEKRGRGYTNRISFESVFNVIGQRMWLRSEPKLTKQRILEKLNSQFFLKTISFDNDRVNWPSGDPKYNHAKFWMVDQDVFYVGSENLYPSTAPALPPGNLQEFGVIAQVTPETEKLILDGYFSPLLTYGKRTLAKLADLTW